MVKHEIRVEMKSTDSLSQLIERAYDIKDGKGTIKGNRHALEVCPNNDKELHTILTGLHMSTVKVTNNELIDGNLRFMVFEEGSSITLSPISIYCIKEDKYIFF
jgi:hypothetical protein